MCEGEGERANERWSREANTRCRALSQTNCIRPTISIWGTSANLDTVLANSLFDQSQYDHVVVVVVGGGGESCVRYQV